MAGTGKPKRTATTTHKAKKAAAIALLEAQEEEAMAPVKRRGCPPGKKVVVQPAANPAEEEDELEVEITTLVDTPVDADDTEIEYKTLLRAIEGEQEIQDGLFPGVGAIKLSSGKPKTHHYYNLAIKLFAKHPLYQEAFAINPEHPLAQQTKQRKLWTEKIKNKVGRLVKKARENITEMGQTGAGIWSEDEILPGTDFANKWDAIKADSPWVFNLRSLIGACPNLQPVGLGNNDTGYDLSVLLRTHNGDDTSSAPDDTQDLPDQLSESAPVTNAVDLTSDSDEELLIALTLSESKRKRADDPKPTPSDVKPPAKKTKLQPPTSVPVVAPPPIKKPITSKDRFAATIAAEEETAQQLLIVRKEKNEGKKEVQLAKIRMEGEVRVARAEARRQERAAKMDLLRLKMEHEHQLRMAQPLPIIHRVMPTFFGFLWFCGSIGYLRWISFDRSSFAFNASRNLLALLSRPCMGPPASAISSESLSESEDKPSVMNGSGSSSESASPPRSTSSQFIAKEWMPTHAETHRKMLSMFLKCPRVLEGQRIIRKIDNLLT
ncbi:hypothetical protein DFH07DRAFT_780716 [Mycena maculata]|uniref:Uncharacterized protein n=1 Tax=Mycena maculata TaxID=230809 RepID=A0AAD7MW14_9AGAR|nr:hypothetical protein DFH07DRAFT_780716 [Mycena maculata]